MNLVRVIPFISWGLPANALCFGGPDPSQNRGMKRSRSSIKPWKAPRPGPLDRVPKLLKRAEDLGADEGKLSAVLVAKLFGLSIDDLAGMLDRTRKSSRAGRNSYDKMQE